MVNGNYVLYEDKPSSESEIVDDHVQTRTADRKNKRKCNRNANELQRTLNMAQLDNETDSVKYEKKIKEPRLLRYVPTTDVKENFVTEKFETYDLKPTSEERPRRYTFQKKPKNPADGSVNYAYSRSSSSCSSPNGNLPTISEHGEQYGTYIVQPLPSKDRTDSHIAKFENKMEKYFRKPKEGKSYGTKVGYEGSHPDSLYRVAASSVSTKDRMMRVVRILQWPVALVAVCITLAVIVYFLMPNNTNIDAAANGTAWTSHMQEKHKGQGPHKHQYTKKPDATKSQHPGTKTPEIDFYDAENDKIEYISTIDSKTGKNPHRVLPIKPVFPSHIAPEVQYGNEKADADKLRTPKVLDEPSTLPDDSTLKPHITQKPEKPLAVYFKDLNEATTTTTETITRAESVNEFGNFGDKHTTKNEEISTKSHPTAYKDHRLPVLRLKPVNIKQYLVTEPESPPEIQYYGRLPNIDVNFTSGHSKLFGISIEDAERLKSTTQSSLYNTRVSPTLPTWRDGDDTTTKKYPVNVNYEVQCRSTRLPLCRGILPYDLAGTAATVSGLDVTSLMSQIEYLVASNCSERVRHFACALLEPECNPPPYAPQLPCYNLCKAITDGCDSLIPRELTPVFNCKQFFNNNCVAAKAPCFMREISCGDGTCIPRDWICDGSADCPGGEDEASCSLCEKHEFSCKSGSCIQKRWVCDGYADCPEGEDELRCERPEPAEPGEESAGSAPAPVISRLNKVLATGELHKTGENDSSKELLVTSDSSNAFKRNFTRRPSPSRLTPYTRPTPTTMTQTPETQDFESTRTARKQEPEAKKSAESVEDVNIGDMNFPKFEKIGRGQSRVQTSTEMNMGRAPAPAPVQSRLDKSISNLEKVINGAALLKKAQEAEDQAIYMDSPESNSTNLDTDEEIPLRPPMDLINRPGSAHGSHSAHASPCPNGELRCVDGRCITLAQLCDGTIDCTDHADEDNCYT